LGLAKSYRPISLLCVPFKILERLIYNSVEPIVDLLLPQEQAGFQHGRSAVDQVTLLTQDIEDSFSVKKTGAVLVDLTSAYDTVWHRGNTSQPQQQNPALLLRDQIPRNNVGQVAHVSPTPRITSQKADIARRTPEIACAGSG